MPGHQPGQGVFRAVLPEDIDWKPFSAFPPSVRLAIVVVDPYEPGPSVIPVKLPSGVKLMPHRHPEGLSIPSCPGSSTSGWATGSTTSSSRHTHRAAWSNSQAYATLPLGEVGYVLHLVSAIGPLGLEYLDPMDDPRNQ